MHQRRFDEIFQLAWIYNRMIKVHNENYSLDYMQSFLSIITFWLNIEFPQLVLVPNKENGIIHFEYSGNQP